MGRLLITFLLVRGGAQRAPLLYLSYYLKLHHTEYYDRLMAIRTNGDWEGWLRFFLRGVAETAREAADTAEQTFELRETHRALVVAETGANGLKLLSLLYSVALGCSATSRTSASSTSPTPRTRAPSTSRRWERSRRRDR